MRKSTAKVSTTAFILGDLEEERGLAEWVPVAAGPVPVPYSPGGAVSGIQCPVPGRTWSQDPRAQAQSWGARGTGGGSKRTWGKCSASEELARAYLCLQQIWAGG